MYQGYQKHMTSSQQKAKGKQTPRTDLTEVDSAVAEGVEHVVPGPAHIAGGHVPWKGRSTQQRTDSKDWMMNNNKEGEEERSRRRLQSNEGEREGRLVSCTKHVLGRIVFVHVYVFVSCICFQKETV
jgi:phage-related protein